MVGSGGGIPLEENEPLALLEAAMPHRARIGIFSPPVGFSFFVCFLLMKKLASGRKIDAGGRKAELNSYLGQVRLNSVTCRTKSSATDKLHFEPLRRVRGYFRSSPYPIDAEMQR